MSGESHVLLADGDSGHEPCSKKTVIIIAIVATIITALTIGLSLGLTLGNKDKYTPGPESTTWYNSFNLWNVRNSLSAFQTWQTRAVGTPGSQTSFEWLRAQLEKLDCVVSMENFSVPVFQQGSEPALSFTSSGLNMTLVAGKDFVQAEYGGVTSALQGVPLVIMTGSGCETSEWASFPTGSAALLDFGGDYTLNCSSLKKALNAQTAGAKLLLIRMSPLVSRSVAIPLMDFPWYEGQAVGTTIPTLVLASSIGSIFIDSDMTFAVTASVNSTTTYYETSNMYCDTKFGNETNTIVIGAHYDTVSDGPGINDDGTGSATLLEIAASLYRADEGSRNSVANQIRFAWWGAEELGLLGSFHFTHAANASGLLSNISAYINLDMVGSPNGYPQIHHSSATSPLLGLNPAVANSSDYIASVLASAFWNSYYYEYIALAPNSDYYPFLYYNIPASGLATGASELMSGEYASRFNRLQNVPLDPCYHQLCDNLGNIDETLLEKMGRAALKGLNNLATDSELRAHLKSYASRS